MLVIMTGMANELIERGESLSFEVRIFSEKKNSEPSGDLLSSSAIGPLGLILKFETKLAEITFL